jgi:hypothetical protein
MRAVVWDKLALGGARSSGSHGPPFIWQPQGAVEAPITTKGEACDRGDGGVRQSRWATGAMTAFCGRALSGWKTVGCLRTKVALGSLGSTLELGNTENSGVFSRFHFQGQLIHDSLPSLP